jgi:hypothetical protein
MSDTTADTIESTPSETDPNVPYRCRYLTTKGEQCRQIALNGRNFCFAHRDPEPDFGCRKIKVPILEDSASIQLMLTKILHGLLNDHFPVAVASKAIYCCQVAASTIARPVAYRPKLGEKLPAEPLAVMEIYKDQQGNLMGPLEEFHLPPAPAEPDSARAKARAEWNPCVVHHNWCPGPNAPYKCADCQRVAQLCSEPPKQEEPAAVATAPEPSKLSPTPDPAAQCPAPDFPSPADTKRCSVTCNPYPVPSPEPCSELAELTATAERSPATRNLYPAPSPAVVDLITPPTNMIPNDKKPAPQGGAPHSQNKSTQKPRSTTSQPLPLLSLEECSTRYFASATELALSEVASSDRVERAAAESEIPASPSPNTHLYPVPCTLDPAISSPPQQTPSTDQLSCRAESALARSIPGAQRETASRGSLRHRGARRERSSSSSRQGRSK